MRKIVTTYLQMDSLTELVPAREADADFIVREAVERDWRLNRSLYLLVGECWEWLDKQRWAERQWQDYAGSEELRTFVATWRGSTAGYYELRRDEARAVEIVYFGLAPDFVGRGLGGALLTDALRRAWAWDAGRVWVHTCTLDHPAALRNYEARGMKVYDRQTHEVA